ncbi:MAG: hypothetical protein LBG20_00245 [Holosporaceae bacterium]|jgi:hypothetical protein|nr:hypothetical protein [Holosporaceae bacterium]
MKKVKWLWCTVLSVFLIQGNDGDAMRRRGRQQTTNRGWDIATLKSFLISVPRVQETRMVSEALSEASDGRLTNEEQADVQILEGIVGGIMEKHGIKCGGLMEIERTLAHVATRAHFTNLCLALNIVSGMVRGDEAMQIYYADVARCLMDGGGCVLNTIEMMRLHGELAQQLLHAAQVRANERELLLKTVLFLLKERKDQLVIGQLGSGPRGSLGITIPEIPCYELSSHSETAERCMRSLLLICYPRLTDKYRVATIFADLSPARIRSPLPDDFTLVTPYASEAKIFETKLQAVYQQYINSLDGSELDLIREVARDEGGEMDCPAREGVVAFLAEQHSKEMGLETRATREDGVFQILEENVLAGRWGNWEVVTLLHFLPHPLANTNVYGKLFRLGLLTEDLVVVNAVIKHMDTMKMDAKKVTAPEIPAYDGSFTMFFLTKNALEPLMFFIKNYPDRFRDEVNRHVPLAEYCHKFTGLCMGTPLGLAAATMGDSSKEHVVFEAMVNASGLTDFFATDRLEFISPMVAAMPRSDKWMLDLLISKQREIKIEGNWIAPLLYKDTFFLDKRSYNTIRNNFRSIIAGSKWVLDKATVIGLQLYSEEVDFDVTAIVLDKIIVYKPETQASGYMNCFGSPLIKLAAQGSITQKEFRLVSRKYDKFYRKLKDRRVRESMDPLMKNIREAVEAMALPEAERAQKFAQIFATTDITRQG